MKVLFLVLGLILTIKSQAQSCFILMQDHQSKSKTDVRIDFIRNGSQWWAGQIEVYKSFPASRDGLVLAEQNFKIKDFAENQFKVLNASTLAKGYVEFMFHYPRNGTTYVQGVPGISEGRVVVSDWLTMGIKDIRPSSNSKLLEGFGGLRDSRSWNTKSYISKDCYL